VFDNFFGSVDKKRHSKRPECLFVDLIMQYAELFLAEDCFFCGLGHAELYYLLGRNLDSLTGLGISAHARLALYEHELAQAREREGIFCFLLCKRCDVF